MPLDLDDDFHSDHDPELAALVRRRRRGGAFGLLLAAVLVIALGGVGAYLFLKRGEKAEPDRPPSGSSASTAPIDPRASGLPSLDESDRYVRELAAALSSHPELARWLSQNALVRTLVSVVHDVGGGESPRLALDFLAPKQRFRGTTGAGKRIVADPASYAAYDTFGDAIASIDVPATTRAYQAAEPLFDAAHREQGHPGAFRSAVHEAIDVLLAVPVIPPNAELVPHTAGFRWADPKLEGLSAAQKQLLRTGPRNVELVQSKLRELKAALGAP